MRNSNELTGAEALTTALMQERLEAVNLNSNVLNTVEGVSVEVNEIF